MKNFFKLKEKREKWAGKLSRLPWYKFAALLPALSEETTKAINNLNPPAKFCGVKCPPDLQRVNYGTLVSLQTSPQENYYNTVVNLVSVLFPGVKRAKIERAPACEILGVVSMIRREMERIGKLFATLNEEPSEDEQRAGVETLQFGAFGIADYYAQRMGICDHEEAFKTPWTRIFRCLSMDKARGDYEKRLRNVIQNKKP